MGTITPQQREDVTAMLIKLVNALDEGGIYGDFMSPEQKTDAIWDVVSAAPEGVIETLLSMMEDEQSTQIFSDRWFSHVIGLMFSRLFCAYPQEYADELERLIDHPVAGPIFLDAMSNVPDFGRVPAAFMPALEKLVAQIPPGDEWPRTLVIALKWQESPRAFDILRATRRNFRQGIDVDLYLRIYESWLAERGG